MSASSSAYVVVGVKFEDIGRTYQEERPITRYREDNGSPYTIKVRQTVVELLGEKIPDEPDPVRPVWNSFGGSDPSYGTKPGHNLYRWLKSKDSRWDNQGDDYGDGGTKANFTVLGVQITHAYQGSCTQTIGEIGDFSKEKALAEELLRAIGYKGEVKVYVVAEIH